MTHKIPKLGTKLMAGFLLISIVALAGCIGGGDGGASVSRAGGDALELSIDTEGRSTFDSEELFIILLEAENTGEFDAENVMARLQGYDGITSESGETLSDGKTLMPSALDRPNYEQDMPGDTGDVEWQVKAPYVSSTAPDNEISLTGEAAYDYRSLAVRKVAIATAAEVDKLQDRGESVPVSSSTETRNGPISIEVETDEPYLRMTKDTENFRFKVTLTNDGSGSVCRDCFGDDPKFDYLRKVNVIVPQGLDVNNDSSCDFEVNSGSGGRTILELSGNASKLRLAEGGVRRDLRCELTADRDKVGGYNTYSVQVEAYYTYLQSVAKKLVVEGTR